jgi:hypothetical protein
LDFETISFAVPIWAGTRPYQALTFQFSVHRVSADGEMVHRDFLDLSGEDPREALAEALIEACEEEGPVFVYSSFEKSRIEELMEQFPEQAEALDELVGRLVDLRPIAERCYYHPDQQGSWSIKKVLPTLSDLDYESWTGSRMGAWRWRRMWKLLRLGLRRSGRTKLTRNFDNTARWTRKLWCGYGSFS